jgi:hypothetical protein
MGFCSALTLVFIVLKLLELVSLSWVVVFAPLAIDIIMTFVFAALYAYVERYDRTRI